jgi:hypothetical protein
MHPGGDFGIHVTIEPPEVLVAGASIFVASPVQIVDWVRRAGSGERCIYARVARLDRGIEGAVLARKLAGEGVIALCPQSRHAAGSPLFDYIARRTGLPVRGDAPPPPDEETLTPEARRVLDHIARQADQGAPASTNRGIARACGLRDDQAARYQLRRLRDLGAIIVKPVPVEPGRQITIVETGARTGLIGRGS